MPKAQDVRPELKEFNALFNKFSYRWDSSQIFHDFLTLLMSLFAQDETGQMQKEKDEAMKRYSEEDIKIFDQMVACYMKTQEEQVQIHKWFDFFGSYYEELSSRSKASGLGQFFTPECIVDMMVAMTPPAPEKITGNRVADPCCGSGRMVLSYHTTYPGNFMYAADIDLICCRMTCVNMMIHGCVGVVEWMNSLNPDDHRQTWIINADLYSSKRPGIRLVPKTKESKAFITKVA